MQDINKLLAEVQKPLKDAGNGGGEAAGRIKNPLAPVLSPTSPDAALGLLAKIIVMLINISLVIAAVVFFFIFLIGGIRWITSSGDKVQIEAARNTIMNALIGLVIVFSLFAILKLIETLFGVELLQIDLGRLKIS